MAAKRVESFRVPCLDAGSTPATSTMIKRILFIYKQMRLIVVLSVVVFGFLHEKWMRLDISSVRVLRDAFLRGCLCRETSPVLCRLRRAVGAYVGARAAVGCP